MSKNRLHAPAYSYFPESFTSLSNTYYDLQEYDLLGRVTEYGAEQFVDDTVRSDIDFEGFAKFHTGQDTLERPRLLLVRKALQELKIMGSISYADCYTVIRGVRMNPLLHEDYGRAFRFSFKPFDIH